MQQDLPFLLKKKMSGRGRGHHRGRSKSRNTHKPKGNGEGGGGKNIHGPPRADQRKALFATSTAANATKHLTFNEVEEALIRKLKKTAEPQDVAQAIESRQECKNGMKMPTNP